MAPKTRRRVVEAAQRLGFGYRANSAARRLARSRFREETRSFDQIGLIYLASAADYLDTSCLAMMREAEHELAQLHACLVFVRANQEQDWLRIRRLAETGVVDGWLILGAVTDEIIDRLKGHSLPFVILGDHRCTQPVHAVNVDNVGVGRRAVEYLASFGHRRIAFIAGMRSFVYIEEILRGFRTAVNELGLDDNPKLTTWSEFWSDPYPEQLAKWLDGLDHRPPTAIFCDGGHKGEIIHRTFKEAGIPVPQQLSILACEPAAASRSPSPDLARIELPLAEIGRQGALLLHKVHSDPAMPASSDIRIAANLVEGWSVARRESPQE